MGILESDQASGENINVSPEVSGPVTAILVKEGDHVRAGQALFTIDESVRVLPVIFSFRADPSQEGLLGFTGTETGGRWSRMTLTYRNLGRRLGSFARPPAAGCGARFEAYDRVAKLSAATRCAT